MNKHGQTLVLFIVLIPIILIVLALIIDIGLVYSEKATATEIAKTSLKEIFFDQKPITTIKVNFENNKIDVNNLKVTNNSNSITIENDFEIDSIFGKIIGQKKYKIKINITGTLKDNLVTFK